MQRIAKEKAEQAVFTKYGKLYQDLVDLVSALNVMEPGGTLLDDIVFTAKEGGKVQVAYVATPIQLTINTPERKFILKVIENAGSDRPMDITNSRIEKQQRQLTSGGQQSLGMASHALLKKL